jgi:hypothetical protein
MAVLLGGAPSTTFAPIAVASALKPVPVGNLTPGTTYSFQVRAFGRLGFTDLSQPVQRMCIWSDYERRGRPSRRFSAMCEIN